MIYAAILILWLALCHLFKYVLHPNCTTSLGVIMWCGFAIILFTYAFNS